MDGLLFKVTEASGKIYRVFTDGQIDGFENAVCVVNNYPVLLAFNRATAAGRPTSGTGSAGRSVALDDELAAIARSINAIILSLRVLQRDLPSPGLGAAERLTDARQPVHKQFRGIVEVSRLPGPVRAFEIFELIPPSNDSPQTPLDSKRLEAREMFALGAALWWRGLQSIWKRRTRSLLL